MYLFIFLVALLCAAPAFAQDKSEREALLNTLNSTPLNGDVKSIGPISVATSGSGAAKFIPDISVIGNFIGAAYTDDPAPDSLFEDDPDQTGFNFEGVELILSSVIDPYLRGDVVLHFHEDGVEAEEAYVTSLSLAKGLTLRGGKFLLPFGRQNQKHSHTWAFVNAPLNHTRILGEAGLNEIGVEASYVFPTPFFFKFTTTFTNGDNEENFDSGSKGDFLYQGRLEAGADLSSTVSMLAGASGAWGRNGFGTRTDTELFGGDFFIKWKPKAYRSLSWQTEALFQNLDDGVETQLNGGFYSYVDWQWAKRWHSAVRFDLTGIPSNAISEEYRISPMISFSPTEFSILRLQYDYQKAEAVEAVHAGFLQLQFSMGPHGAHAY